MDDYRTQFTAQKGSIMKAKKILSTVLAALMLVGTAITPIAAAENGTAYTDDKGNWFYEPLESGVHSNGGYAKGITPDCGTG